MDPDHSDMLRNLRLAIASGELTRENTLEEVASKLEEIIYVDSLDIVELIMALEEKGVTPTVGELVKLLEGNGPDDGEFTAGRK